MKLTWDEAKRQTNCRKHGFDFADAINVFDGLTLTFEDERFEYSQQRFITIGRLVDVVVVIVYRYTEIEEEIQMISMRKATKHEQKRYFKGLSD
ncbi:MAG: BrnT family toxin [Candidatus Parabeggiatoa sp. nov. 3]|nr:MAG: BrnT family toxin [Gammaproteobacteria bacterium]RKZ56273.1 MAG: BrnT family toxin [Gammaproteobacteria bacterium]RKZ82483.1 MAG: BrnT family toxin [Gammaproteobacteria bacterium]